MYLIPGILGFITCCIFDLNKVHWHSKFLNHFFTLGSLLLALSTVLAVLQSNFNLLIDSFEWYRLGFLAGTILSGIALIYTLFFALPVENTYNTTDTLSLIDSGAYALCRHPGFWPFGLFYLFLSLLLSNPLVGYAAIIYSICNFIYIYIQDYYIFPLYIKGYDNYKKTVPFLIPTRNSLRRALNLNF